MDSVHSAQSVGTAIARARSRAGLSLRELSQRTGIHWTTIHAIERGRITRPGLASVSSLARALGLSVGELASMATAAPEPRRAAEGGT